MSKKLREVHIRQPSRQGKDESQAWSQKYGRVICARCHSYYDRGSWKYLPQEMKKRRMMTKNGILERVKYTTCGACRMERGHFFMGKITVEHIPSEYFFDLLQLINHIAEKNEARSSQRRVISVVGDKEKLVVTTTQNRLVGKLLKK